MVKSTAVIGVGWFGRAHARVYNELSNLTAVCDLNKKAVMNLANQYGINSYTDVNEMLKNEQIDSLSIVTPPSALPPLALTCAKAGVNILIEKPLGNRVKELTPLLEYNQSIRIMPGHLELFNPVTEDLHNNIDKIGTPIYVSSRRIGLYPRRQWGIGVMHDLGYHEIYMQRSLFGNPTRVESLMRSFKNNHEDSALVLMKFENGVNGLIEANWLTPTKFRQLTVFGSEGAITIDYISQGITVINAEDNGTRRIEKLSKPYSTKEPLRREIDTFLSEKALPVTLEDGIDTLELTLKTLEVQG